MRNSVLNETHIQLSIEKLRAQATDLSSSISGNVRKSAETLQSSRETLVRVRDDLTIMIDKQQYSELQSILDLDMKKTSDIDASGLNLILEKLKAWTRSVDTDEQVIDAHDNTEELHDLRSQVEQYESMILELSTEVTELKRLGHSVEQLKRVPCVSLQDASVVEIEPETNEVFETEDIRELDVRQQVSLSILFTSLGDSREDPVSLR